MKTDSITFRVEPQKREMLDDLTTRTGASRSTLLNEALDNYLELQAWQIAHIEEGLRQADAGEFVPEEEVEAFFKRFKK